MYKRQIQSYASVIGGTLEGDAGNIGYSSAIHGVINIAGGINDVNWIDSNDEPIVSAQGNNDNTVNFNCGPGLNNPSILTLCGVGEIHPKADNVGILNDMLIFNNTDHSWAALGNANTKFIQAIDFFSDFEHLKYVFVEINYEREIAIKPDDEENLDLLYNYDCPY